MVTFPKNGFRIKVDPFWQLRYSLLLWGQRKDLMLLCLLILGAKWFGFVTRSIFILHSLKNPEVLLEVSATYPIPFLALLKMTFLFFRRHKLNFVYNAISEKFWDLSVGGPLLENLLQKRYKLINYLLLGHATTSVFYVIMHLLFAQVPIPEGRTRWLPTLISIPFDPDQSPLHEILYVILTWNMLMSVFGNGFFDLLFVYGAQHLCGQFLLLRELLKKLSDGLMQHFDDVEKFKSGKFQKKIRERIAICVRHHNLLLRYGNELKSLTSAIVGIQLLTTLLTLVLMGYTISKNLEHLTKSAMLLSFVFSSTAQFIIFAVQSGEINHLSISIADAAYQSNWYLFDAKAKRALTFLIMNAQPGLIMYGAELVEMNNEVIVQMGQKVFSFITLLRSIDEQK